jgi:hypothetical protein
VSGGGEAPLDIGESSYRLLLRYGFGGRLEQVRCIHCREEHGITDNYEIGQMGFVRQFEGKFGNWPEWADRVGGSTRCQRRTGQSLEQQSAEGESKKLDHSSITMLLAVGDFR